MRCSYVQVLFFLYLVGIEVAAFAYFLLVFANLVFRVLEYSAHLLCASKDVKYSIGAKSGV